MRRALPTGVWLLALALVAASCARAEPTISPDRVEVVFSKVPAVPSGDVLSPLWGDRVQDREHIARLIMALDTAKQVDPSEQEAPNERGRYLAIRYRDGAETMIRTVAWCDEWSSGGLVCKGDLKRLPDRFFVEGTDFEAKHIESSALRDWWDSMQEYMQHIGRLDLPETVAYGEPVIVSGAEWTIGDRIKLSVEVSEGRVVVLLGEVPLDDGSFYWQGMLPAEVPTGEHYLLAEVPGVTGWGGATERFVVVDSVPSPTATPTYTPTPAPTPTSTLRPTATPLPTPTMVAEFKDMEGGGEWCVPFPEGVPGIGGAFKDAEDNSITYIYLTDPTNEEALRAIRCLYTRPGETVRILQGQYTIRELEQWKSMITAASGDIPGISWTDASESQNRVQVGLTPRRGTLELLDAALEKLDIPKAAVIIRHPRTPERIPIEPDPQLAEMLGLSLDVLSQVSYGETVQFSLTVKNLSDQTVDMTLGDLKGRGYPGSRKFLIIRPNGAPVWMSGGLVLAVASGVSLAPGQELEFRIDWEQVDYLSNDVPPGVYLVYGVFEFTAGFGGEKKMMEAGPEVMTVLEP